MFQLNCNNIFPVIEMFIRIEFLHQQFPGKNIQRKFPSLHLNKQQTKTNFLYAHDTRLFGCLWTGNMYVVAVIIQKKFVCKRILPWATCKTFT